jgi:hypothetical protein
MRLNEELIKQAILHPDQDVRTDAILYFSRSKTADDSILPLAIQAIEQYGWDKAFTLAACISGLPLNDTTLLWVLAQLQHADAKKPDPCGWSIRWDTLNALLSEADAGFLTRHQQAILDVERLDERVFKTVEERICFLAAGSDFCWEELEKFCEASKDCDNLGEVDLDHAYAFCEAIGRDKAKYADKVLTILGEKIEDFESNPKVWGEVFAVRIAGEMRLGATVPLIIAKLEDCDEDDDWFFEECERALPKIGGDTTISAIADMYRQGDWNLRSIACEVMQHVHSDLAVQTALEFLASEKDESIRASLGSCLAAQLAFEAIEPLRQLVIRDNYDGNYADLKRDVVVAATMMGVEFPEREQWKADVERKQLERERKNLKERLEKEVHRLEAKMKQVEQFEPDEEELPPEKIGRNDPCPCGSGKKFKKCCLKKQNDNAMLD